MSRTPGRCCRARLSSLLAAVLVTAVAAGCQSGGTPPPAPRGAAPDGAAAAASASAGAPGRAGRAGRAERLTPAEMRSLAAAAADNYTTIVAQASDQVRASTTRPAVADWAWQTKIATALAAYANATGPNDAVCLLDMVVFATLKRHAVEEHWVPTLLGEAEGAPVLDAYRRGEASVWQTSARALSTAQQEQLRRLIDEWIRKNPGQFYVSHIRFADLAAALKVTAASPEIKLPGNIFGLMFMDPLAGLDPVTRELREYRALMDRLIFMTVRMPLVLGWQAEYAAIRASSTPEVHRFLDLTDGVVGSANRFADMTSRFTDTADRLVAVLNRYPGELTKERQAALAQVAEMLAAERQAALDQAIEGVADERAALTAELVGQQSQLRQTVADVRGLVETTEQAVRSANDSTSRTIVTTEEASRRTIRDGFRMGVGLLVVLIVLPPVTLLLYRLASRRWVGASVSHPPRSPALVGEDVGA
jgi:hypothetical protein